MSILFLSFTSLALAGSKVDVCHKGTMLNVSSSAVPAHLGHGDDLPSTWFLDTDGDGYGDPLAASTACAQPAGTVSNDDDCDPDDAAVNPGATEVCNGFDDDCDGSSDGPDASDATVFYADLDGDGFGNASDSELACTQPGGTSTNDDDCNDSNPAVNPAALETCSNGDDDCDGLVDEGDATDAGTWYSDEDGDGYGDPTSSVNACEAPTGYVPDDTDCDDLEALSFPGNPEVCDLVDNDCDLDVDEDAVDAFPWYADDDSDGYGAASELVLECEAPPGYVADSQDCDDGDASISPAGEEVCDTIDNDCDLVSDEPDAADAPTWYADLDGDGFGDSDSAANACEQPVDYVADDQDCDDGDGTSSPDGEEVCEDGIDQDCSGADEECAVACASNPDAELIDPDLVILGPNSDFSEVVATGDLDGDGRDDLLATGPYSSSSGTHYGVYGFYSPLAAPSADVSDAGLVFDGTGNHNIFATRAGDVDNDGYDDLLFGAARGGSGSTASDSGKAYLVHGPFSGGYATAASAADVTWTGVYTGGYWGSVFGNDVEVAGDHTGDGVNEWLVADNRTRYLAGAVFLLNGAAVGSQSASSATATIVGDRSQDRLGHAIGGADLNGDGFDDIAVGATDDNDDPSAHGGKVGIFYGPVAGTYSIANADVRLNGAAAYDYAGIGILFSDDIDGDGLADVVFGAFGDNGGASDGGAAYVIAAMADGSYSLSSAYARILGDEAGGYAGYTVAAPGDVDGDGLADVLVGVPYSDSCGSNAGSVALVLSPAGTSNISDAARIWSGYEGTRMGVGLTTGDINGDGLTDLVNGARGDGSGSGFGALYTTFGPLY